MAKLRTRKWLLSAVASLTCLLAVGLYALAQAPDEGSRASASRRSRGSSPHCSPRRASRWAIPWRRARPPTARWR